MEHILCPWEDPKYFFVSSNVPFLLPYSHFIALFAAILSIIFIYKSKDKVFGQIFFLMSVIFSVWVLGDWHIWATNRSDYVIFFWSVQILLEILVYVLAFFLTYTFINKKNLTFNIKYLGFAFLLPIIVLLPTNFILNGIDTAYCDATETMFVILYTYSIETLIIILILNLVFKGVIQTESEKKYINLLFGFGIITFLLSFTSGNIIGSITENWEYAQFGLFGMPIFMGILSYTIIRYNAFNTKTFGAQILVSIIFMLTSGILFLRTIERVRLVTAITLILVTVLGAYLIKSVKREIEQREKIERLAIDLEKANEKLQELDQMKSEFLSLATHQIRAPLTAIKGYASMLYEGDFGVLPEKAKHSSEVIVKSTETLITIVNDFLNISRIEQGRMVYDKSTFKINEVLKEVVLEIEPNISKAKLELDLNVKEGPQYEVTADKAKIKQIIGNIIDNSIKYTQKGFIHINLFEEQNMYKISIKDSGVGIEPNEINKLFTKFSRTKDASKVNVIGTGLGLYIAKKMVTAQGGDIEVKSEGLGKGTEFIINFPKN